MDPWILYFDGLCEPVGTSGRMCWAWLLDRGPAGVTSGDGTKGPHVTNTNNIAEYSALGTGLRELWIQVGEAVRAGGHAAYPGVVIRGDSKLVCCQVDGEWSVKSEHLKPLHRRCLELLAEIEKAGGPPYARHAIEWIPRDENQLADALSREAYRKAEGRMPPERRKGAA